MTTTTAPARRHFSGTLNFPEPVKGGATALRRAGIDWSVSAVPLSEYADGAPGSNRFVAAVRDSDLAFLGVNGTRHQLIQNSVLAELGDAIIQMNDSFRYVGGGAFPRGDKTYLVLRSDHVLTFGDDADRGFESILLVNDFNGNSPLTATTFIGRLACTNQFSGLTRGRTGTRIVRIPHTKSATERIGAAKDILRAAVHEVDAIELELRRLLETPMTVETAAAAAVGPAPRARIGDDGQVTNARAISTWEAKLMAFRAELAQDYNDHIAGTALGAVMAAQALDEHGSRSADRDKARVDRIIAGNYPTMNRVLAALAPA